jgi:DMSO reductase anchor subunit
MLFVVGLLTWFALGWVAMRLSLVLPARAVDRPLSFGDSWAATDPASGAIAMVVLALATLNVVLSLALGQLGFSLATALLSIVVQWFTAMLGLSVLTTLYGALVQRRPLDV